MLLPASVEASPLLPLLLPLLLSPSEAWKYPAQPGGMYQPFVYQDITVPSPSPAAAHSDDGGIFFSGFFTDHAVLQRGTKAKAAVYGAVTGAAKSITVVVAEEGADSYHVAAQIASQGVGNLTWKALLKPHPAYGGNVTITARCDGCTGNTSTTISGLTYGDVWFCSGQSNMELPMQHGLTRNRTYELLAKGHYSNIRTYKRAQHLKLRDGESLPFVLPPPAPPSCPERNGRFSPDVPTCYHGWQLSNASTVDEFSAACWFTAQELTDIEIDANRSAPILGMVQSAWGGTEITSWIKNSSIACKNASGTGPQKTGGGGGTDAGALWNGMVSPFINATIFGALWYQGENNVHDCVGAGKRDSGINACGNVLDKTGYACSTHNLVTSWREQWSIEPDTTDAQFPFGIVSLAAGTSEGHSKNMGNFRHAQTASYGFLPGPAGSGMEKTFIAQAYDAGDPGMRSSHYEGHGGDKTFSGPVSQADSPFQESYDMPFPGRVGWAVAGHQSFTQQYMGGLHPRAKQTVGRRLALAAAAVAYDRKVPFTGPKLKNCSVLPANVKCFPGDPECASQTPGMSHSQFAQRQITLNFDEELLGDDAVQVWPTQPDTEGLAMTTMYNCLNGTCLEACSANATCVEACAVLNSPQCRSGLAVSPVGPAGNGGNPTQYQAGHMFYKTGRTLSPLEVQLNGTLWMPASINFNADHPGDPIQRGSCKFDPETKLPTCTNWTRVRGWSSVVGMAPTAIPIGCGQGVGRDGFPNRCPPPEALAGRWCENCTAHFQITGVRYAWAETPCCGGNLGSDVIPCPVNSCPISTFNSTLPAVPFQAQIKYTNDTAMGIGSCQCTAPQKC